MSEVTLLEIQVICNVKFKKLLIKYMLDKIKLSTEIIIQSLVYKLVNTHLIQDLMFTKKLNGMILGPPNKKISLDNLWLCKCNAQIKD